MVENNDDEAYLIKERSEAVRRSSILSILKEKEFEIKADIVKTRQKADEIVESAKADAEKLIEEARKKAEADAQKKIEEELKKAKKRAQALIEQANQTVPEIEKQLKERIEPAAELLISFIFGESTPEFLKKKEGE